MTDTKPEEYGKCLCQSCYVLSCEKRNSPIHAKAGKPSYDDLVQFVRWAQSLHPAAVRIMREHNMVLDDLNEPMQKLAFTFYTDLCEIECKVRHLLEEDEEQKIERCRTTEEP
jgi:hypothetical protein